MSEPIVLAAPDAAPVPTPVPAEAPKADAAPPQDGAQVEDQPEDPAKADDQSEKPRQKASERIGELYGKMKAMERERNQALAEVDRLRKPMVSQEQWDAMTFDQQQAAQVRHAVRQERAEELAAEAQRKEADASSYRAEAFNQRVAELAKTLPDIATVVTDPTLPVSPIGARFITENEKGPQVAYWLSQNRAEAARIASLDPYQQAFELGSIVQRVAAAPASRKVSQAPAPVSRVSGGANAGAKDPASMSMAEYSEWYRKRGKQ